MSDDESVTSLELGQEVEDDVEQGSPKSVAWKYAWSMESSQAGSVNGTGNAASERLYKGARSQRETRERMQRMEQKRQDYTAGHKPYATQASNPRRAGRVPGRPATHTFPPRLGQGSPLTSRACSSCTRNRTSSYL